MTRRRVDLRLRRKDAPHCGEASFYDCPRAWRAMVRRAHPHARITTDAAGVMRAHREGRQVGIFGKLPGHGVVMSLSYAAAMYRSDIPRHMRGGRLASA